MALSEGMVAVVRSAEAPGGLCVTLMEGNRQYTLMPNSEVPLRMQSNTAPYPRKSQSTGTQKTPTAYNEEERHRNVYDSSTQAVDGHYASMYKMAHCNLHPTSPPVELAEFPPQRSELCPGQENFVIGGCGSRSINQSPPRNSTNFRTFQGSNWPAQEASAPSCPRSAHRSDAFAKSLRRYPSMSPERSAEVVERLINYSNMRNNKNSPERLLMPKNHSQCSKCSTPMTECFQQIDSRHGRSPRAEIYDESPTRDRWQCGEEKESLPSRCDVRSMTNEKYKDFQKVVNSFPANLCPSIMERLNHIPSKFNNNMPAANKHHFVNMETQAAVPTVSREMETVPRPPPELRNVAVFVSPASSSPFSSDSQHLRLKIIRHSKSISIQTQISDVLIIQKKSAQTCFSSVNIRNNKKVGHKRRSKSQVELKIDDDLDEQIAQFIQDLTKPSAHLRSKLKKAKKQKHDKHEPKVKIDECENEPLLLSEINLKEFTRELSNDLLSKIKRQNIIIQPTDLYRSNYFDLLNTNYEQCFIFEIVVEWLNNIPIKRTDYLGRPVVKENILETIADKVHNILINKLKYSEASTKADIIDILEDMPIDVTGHPRRSFLNKLVTELTSKVKMSTSKNQWKKLPDFCNYLQPTDEEVKQFIENEVIDLQRKFSLLICHDTVGHMINELTAILLDSMEAIKRGKIRDVIDEVLTITSEFLTISEFQSIYFAHNLVYNLFQQSNCNEPHSCDFLCYNSKIQETNDNNTDSSVENETEHENTDFGSDFAGQIAAQVNEWLSSIKDIEKINPSSKLAVVNDLTGDIVDRRKYLEINPSLPNSGNEDLEHLKYQIFKWVNKVLGENNTDTLAKAPDLLERIKNIRVTQTGSLEEIIVTPNPTYHSLNVPNEKRRNSRPDGQPNRSSIKPAVSPSASFSSVNVPNEQRRSSRPDGQPNRSSIKPAVLPSATFSSVNVPNEQRRNSRPDGQPKRSSIKPAVSPSASFSSANVPNEQRRSSRLDGQPNRVSIKPAFSPSASFSSVNVPNEQRRSSSPDGQPNRSSIKPAILPSATFSSVNVPNEQRRNSRPDGQPKRSSIKPAVSPSASFSSANVPNEQRRSSRPDGQPNRVSIKPAVSPSASFSSANVPNEQIRSSRPDGQPNRLSIKPTVSPTASVSSVNVPNDEQRRSSRPDGPPNRSSIKPAVSPSASISSVNEPNEQRRNSRPDGQPNRSSIEPAVSPSAFISSVNEPNEQRRNSRPDGQPNRSSINPAVSPSAFISSVNEPNEQRRNSRPDGQPNRSSINPAVSPSAFISSVNEPNEQRRNSSPDGQPNRSSINPAVSPSAFISSVNGPNEQRRNSSPDGQPNRSSINPAVSPSAFISSVNEPNEQRRSSRPDGQPNRSSIKPAVFRSATVSSAAQNNSIKQLNEEYDAYLKDWVQRVPIAVAKPKDEAIAEKARLGLYIGVWKAITKLKMNPEILDNPYHYQDALDDELEILLQCLPQTREFKTEKHVLKPELIEKTMIFNERVANVAGSSSYRQQLVDNVNNSLPKQTEINTAGKDADRLYEEWEKNVLAEYYILYNRFKIDDRVKAMAFKKKLMQHIEKMIDNIKATTKQELKELDYHTYEDEILAALDEVPIPSDETLNEEAGEILILLEVEQWFRDLPLLPSKKEGTILEVKVFQDLLARKLYDIDAHCNPTKRTDLLKQEIRRFLERLPLREEEKPNMNFMIEELLNRLNNVNSDVVVVGGETERKPNWNFLEAYDYDAFSRNLPVSSTFEGNPPRDLYDGSSYFISEGDRVPNEQGWQMIRNPTGISEQYLTIEGLTGPQMSSAPLTPQYGGVSPSNQSQSPNQGPFRTEQTMNDRRPSSGNGTRNGQTSSRSLQIVDDPVSNFRNQNQSGYGSPAGGYDPNRLQPPPVDLNKTPMPQQYRTSPMPDSSGFPIPQDHRTSVTPTPQDHRTSVPPTPQDNERYATPRQQSVDCRGMPIPQDYGTSAMPRPQESETSGMPTPQDNRAYGMSRPRSSSTPQDLRTSGTCPMQKPHQSGTSAVPTPQDCRASAMPRPQDNGIYNTSRPQYGTSPIPRSLPPGCCATPRYGASAIPRSQEQSASATLRPIDNGSLGMPRPQPSSTPQELRTLDQGTNPIPRTLDSGTTPVCHKSVRQSSGPPSYRPSKSQYQNIVPPTPDPYTPYSTPYNETPQIPRNCRKERRDSARRKLRFDETENDSDTDYGCRCMEKIWRCTRRKPMCEMRGYIPCEEMPCFMRMREPCYYR